MLKALAVLVLAIAAPAFGQAETTTCNTVGGTITCQTYPAAAPLQLQPYTPPQPRIQPIQPVQPADLSRLTPPDQVGKSLTDSFYRGAEEGRRAREARLYQEMAKRERAREDAEAAQAAAAREIRQQAGEKVRLGDCDGAVALALDHGDFELASSVQQFCSKGSTVAP